MYISYIRNSRLTTTSTLPHIKFMCASLIECFSIYPSLSYQLIFVYTRQLASQLRTAYSGKKVSIATWPFVHSLELFTGALASIKSESFVPLIYPVVQVALGVVQLLRSARHIPTRLHIVEMLLRVAEEREVFIPMASILLEVSVDMYMTIALWQRPSEEVLCYYDDSPFSADVQECVLALYWPINFVVLLEWPCNVMC